MFGWRKWSLNAGMLALACMWMGAPVYGDPGDIWGMNYGEVEVGSLCTGAPGASETGSTYDAVVGTDGVADEYWAAYSASCDDQSFNVTCGSNVDEQEVVDFSMSSTTIKDLSDVAYEAEYDLLHETGGSSTTTVYICYRFTSVGDSHSSSDLIVRKNGNVELTIHVATDEVIVKDGAGNILDSFDPQQNYYNHNFVYDQSFPITLSTGDTLKLKGGVTVVATEDGSDLSTLDVDVSTIGPT